MKILIATLGHTPDDDRVFHKETRSLLKAGYEVTLATRYSPVIDPGLGGFRHIDFGSVSAIQYCSALQSFADEWLPEVLQVHEFNLLPVGGRIKQRLGIPLVYDVQDPHQEMWAAFSSKPPVIKHIINWGLLRFEKMHLKHVDCVCSLSTLIDRRYRAWGLKTVLVPNYPHIMPVDLKVPRESVVIYEGQISQERGIGLLIQAFAKVIEVIPEAQLEIVGPERVVGFIQQLQGSIARDGLSGPITIRPTISYQEILARLTRAQVGVIPFTDKPLFHVLPPNKLYEYMLCGCAIVASDLPILRQDGQDAVLFVPPGQVWALAEALIRLLKDADLQQALAARGRQLVETQYHWERIEPDYLRIYEDLA